LRSLGQLFTDGQRQTRKCTTRSSTYCCWVNCILKQGIFISRNGMEKLSNRRERKKLCLMYNMYHGHAPSYLCDLLPPLVRDVTNYPVRNRNDNTVQRCCLSLYQSSFIPSVINLLNSLDNDTRNTRTFDTFKINLKRKVVLAKILAHFLVGNRRPTVVYARLRRNCSSLKYDIFRSNIITDSRCVCGYTCIREDASHFLLNCRLYIEQRPIIFNFCTTTFFGEILELCYLETLKKTRLKLFCYQVQYRHSLRTVGDSLKEHNFPTFFYFSVIVQFSIS
jgi:hypothetical protein